MKISTKQRFALKTIRAKNNCFVWIGSKDQSGYGHFYDGSKIVKAHRFAYELFKEKIPNGKFVCHKCDNPPCVNPNHLFIGSHTDNMRDMIKKKRWSNGNRVGELNPCAKLTERKVLKIRSLRHSALTYKSLSKMFNVSKTLVAKICREEIWDHI